MVRYANRRQNGKKRHRGFGSVRNPPSSRRFASRTLHAATTARSLRPTVGVSEFLRLTALASGAIVAAWFLLFAAAAQAAPTYYWDTSGSSGIQGGNGMWSTSSAYWSTSTSGTSLVDWTAGNNADFYAGSGTITVSGSQSVANIIFDTGSSGYTISSGTLNLSGGSITANQAATISSTITGAAGLTKLGAAALTLSGTDTYSGGTTISAGTLQLGDGTAKNGSVAGNIAVANNAALVFADPLAQTYSGTLSGSGGALVKTAAGMLTLSNALALNNTGAVGSLYLNAGTLSVASITNNAGATGNLYFNGGGLAGGTTLTANGTLDVNVSAAGGAIPGTLNNSGTLNTSFSAGGTLQTAGISVGAASLLSLSGSGTLNVTTTGTLYLPSSGTLTANVSSGGALLVPNSTDIRICNVASSTFTANVNGGTVSLNGLDMNPNNGTTYGATLIANVSNGGLFNVSGGIALNTGGAANNGLLSLSVSSGSTLQVGGYGFGLGGGGALSANVLSGGTIQTTVLSGGGAVTVSGAGLFQVKGTGNGYSGNLALNGGTLQFGTPTTNAGSGFGGIGNITTAPGTTLLFSGTTSGGGFLGGLYGTNSLGIGGAGTIVFNNAGAADYCNVTLSPSFAGTINVQPNLSMILSSGSAYGNPALVQFPSSSSLRFAWWNGGFAGNPAISFPLQIAGTGVGGQGAIIPWGWAESLGNPTPSAANTCVFAGPITLTGNTLINNTDVGIYCNISGVISGSNYQLQIGPDTTWAHYLTLSPSAQNTFGALNVNAGWTVVAQNGYAFSSGSLLISGGEVDTNGNNFSFANLSGTGGNIYNGGTTVSMITVGSDNSSTVFSGGIIDYNASNIFTSGTASLSLIKTGTGTLTLTGYTGYSGTTSVSGGTLLLANASGIPNSTFDTSGSGALSFGALTSATFAGLQGSGGLALSNASSAAVSLTVGGNGQNTTLSGALGGNGSLTKVGAGTLTLSGTNAYSGTTTVNVGALMTATAAALPGYASANMVSVASGAMLGVRVGGPGEWSASNINTLLGSASFPLGSLFGMDTSDAGGSYTYSGALTGNFGLNKLGGGVLVLLGANTYNGATLVTTGTLQVGNGTTSGGLPNGSVSLANGTGLAFNLSSGLTVSGAITGSGGLVQAGPGTLTLSNSGNTFTGYTTISAGTVQLGSAWALQDSVVALSGGNLNLAGYNATLGGLAGSGSLGLGGLTITLGNNPGTYTYSGNLVAASSASGGLTMNGPGTQILTGTNSFGVTSVNGGVLAAKTPAALPNYTLSGSASVAPGAMLALNVGGAGEWTAANVLTLLSVGTFSSSGSLLGLDTSDAGGVSFTYSNSISGAMGLDKLGPGMLVLGASNTYSGPTTVSGGTLLLGNANSVQNSTVAVNSAGGLGFGGGITTFNAGGLCGSGALALANTGGSGINLSVGSDGQSTVFSSNLSGGSLTKTGSGTLTLSGTNTYGGTTAVNSGALVAATPAALPGYASAGAVSVAPGATLGVRVGGPGQWGPADIVTLTSSASFSSGSILGLDTTDAGGSFTYSGAIGSAFGLNKLGSGQLVLAGTNNGLTIVSGGVLAVRTPSALTNYSSTGNVSVFPGATLALNIGGTGEWTAGNVGTLVNSASFSAGSLLGLDTSDVTGGSYTYSGAIPNNSGFMKLGSGVLVLPGSNAFNGPTTISGGTLLLGNANSVNSSSLTVNAVNGLAFAAGIGTANVAGLSGSGSFALTDAGGGAVNLNTGGNNQSTTFSGVLSGSGGLTKVGSGLLQLAASNTYGGGTTISAGTLQLGSGTNDGTTATNLGITGNYNIAAGATLLITGTTPANGAFPRFGIPRNGTYSGGGNLFIQGTNPPSSTTLSCLFQTVLTNSFSGTITVHNANYALATPADYGAAASLATTDGGALFITGDGTYNVPMSISGMGYTSQYWNSYLQNGAICIGTYGVTLAGPITLTGNARIDATEMNSTGPVTTITGQITGPYQLQIGNPTAVNGGGTLVLAPSAQNTYGSMVINGYNGIWTVVAGNQYAFSTGPLTFNGNADTLETNGYNFSVSSLTGTGQSSQSIINGGAANSTITIGSDNTSTTYFGLFGDGNGGGMLTVAKTGSGTFTLSNPNTKTWTGGLQVNQGTVVLVANGGGSAVLGAAPLVVNSGGTVVLSDSGGGGNPLGTTNAAGMTPVTINGGTLVAGNYSGINSLTMNGGTVSAFNGNSMLYFENSPQGAAPSLATLANSGAVATIASRVYLTASTTTTALVAAGGGAAPDLLISGQIWNTSGALVKTGNGMLSLTNTGNSFYGGMAINGGIVSVPGGGSALGNGAVILGGGTLQVVGSAALTDNNTFTLTAPSAIDVESSAAVTLSSLNAGNFLLTKTGSGELVLAGASAYTGGTTISAGTLGLGNTNSLQNSTVSVNSAGGLNFAGGITSFNVGGLAGSGTFALTDTGGSSVNLSAGGNGQGTTFSGNLSGSSGSLSKTGSGELVLSGTNSYGGVTAVSQGILEATTTAALPNWGTAGKTSVAASATLAVRVGGSGEWTAGYLDTLRGAVTFPSGAFLGIDTTDGSLTYSGGITGAGGLRKLGPGGLVLTGSSTYTGATQIDGGTLQIGNGGSGASIGGTSGVVDNGGLVFDLATAATFSGAITGSGGVLQTAASLLSLSNSGNTFSGYTTLSAGTVQLGGALALQDSVVAICGGSLNLGGYNATLGGLAGSGNLSLGGLTISVGNNPGTYSYSGNLVAGSSASGGLTKIGPGTQILAGSNSFGVTVVSAGILEASTTSALPNYTLFGSVSVTSGATLAVRVGGAGEWTAANIDSLRGAATFPSDALLGLDTSDGNFNYGSNIGGVLGLNKLGPGTLVLGASNAYSGPTTVSGGTLLLGNANSLLNSTVAVNSANGLAFAAGIGTFNAGGLSGGSSFALTDTGSVPVYLNVGGNGQGTTFSGALGGGGRLTKAGSAALVLTGNNTYSGTTTVSGGTLQIGANTAMQMPASSPFVLQNAAVLAFNLNGGNTAPATVVSGTGNVVFLGQSGGWYSTANASFNYSGTTTVALAGGGSLNIVGPGALPVTSLLNVVSGNVLLGENQTVAGLSGSGGSLNASGAPSTLTVNLPAGLSTSYAGALGNDPGNSANTLSLILAGAGVEVLTGSNAFSGQTTISGGTLALGNANALNQSTVAVNTAGGLSFSSGIATFNVGGLSGSGSLALANTGGITLSLGGNGQAAVFAGSLNGSGSLAKTGSGLQALTGGNSYTGTTAVNAGILEADQPGSLPGYSSSGKISVAASATLAVNMGGAGEWQGSNVDTLRSHAAFASGAFLGIDTSNAASAVVYSSSVGGAIGLVKLGAGELLLTGSNTYTGGTVVNGGILEAKSPLALPNYSSAGSLAVAAGATLAVSVGGAGEWTAANVDSLRGNNSAFPAGSWLGLDTTDGNFTYGDIAGISAAGGLSKLGPGMLTLTGANTYPGPTSVSGGTLQIGNGTSGESLASPSITNNATLVFNHADALVYGGVISGSGGLLKTGGGTLTLSGGNGSLVANTYTGTTTVNGGVLAVGGSGGAFLVGGGIPGNLTIAGGAAFQCLQENIIAPTALVSLASGGSLDVNGFNNTIGYLSGAGSIINSGSTTTQLTLALGSGGQTFSGSISDFGTAAANLQVGGINGSGPQVLNPASPMALTWLGVGGYGSISTANLTIAGGSIAVGSSASSGGVVLGMGGPAALNVVGGTLNCSAGLAAALQLGALNNSALNVSGSGCVMTQQVWFGAPACFANASTINLGDGATFYNGTSGLLNTGPILNLYGTGGSLSINFNGGTLQASAASASFMTGLAAATIESGGARIDTQSYNITIGQALLHEGSLGSSPDGGLNKLGGGVLTLAGGDTYNGPTTITAGTLVAGAANALSGNSAVTISGGTLDVSGFANTVKSLTISSGGLNLGLGKTLTSSGPAAMAGNLNVSGVGTLGSYTLLSYTSTTGAFTSTTGLDPNYGLLYTATALDAQHKAQVGALTVTAVNPTVITGGETNLTLSLGNSAPALSDALNFTASASGAGYGLGTTGSLAATGSGSFTIANGFNSTGLSAGIYAGTVTVTGTNSALNGAALGSGAAQTASVTVLGDAASALSISATNFGRVMRNRAVAVQTLLSNTAATYRAGLQITSLFSTSGSIGGVTVGNVIANGGSTPLTISANTGMTGTYSSTSTIGLSDDQSLNGWSTLSPQTFVMTGAVVDNRVVTANGAAPIDFGVLHVGSSASQPLVLSSTGADSSFTRVAVANGTDGAVSVSGGNPTSPFGSLITSDTRTIGGTFNTAGTFSNTITLSNTGEGLSGESPIPVSVGYIVQVFSGSGRWTGNSSASWGTSASANWTDTSGSGVQAAPGTWGASDMAVLDDSGGTKTVRLDGASPLLAALTFNTAGSGYTLVQGSGGTLNLGNGANPAAVTVSSGTQSITAPITLTGSGEFAPAAGTELSLSGSIGGTGALSLTDSGTLILSGADDYSGGTNVEAGTLYATNSSALGDAMGLTVGAGGTLIFGPSDSGAPAAASTFAASHAAEVAAVPEPGTLALLVAGPLSAVIYRRLRRRSLSESRPTSARLPADACSMRLSARCTRAQVR